MESNPRRRDDRPQQDDQPERRVICPFCRSGDTEPHAMFGSMMLMEQHYCRACRTVFERVRDDEPDAY
jgi:hypothetical protein